MLRGVSKKGSESLNIGLQLSGRNKKWEQGPVAETREPHGRGDSWTHAITQEARRLIPSLGMAGEEGRLIVFPLCEELKSNG